MSNRVDPFKAEVQYQQAAATVRIDVTKSNIATLVQKMGMLIDATKAGGQASAQMAASALSAVNLSGSLSNSASVSQGSSYSQSDSWSLSADSTAVVPRTSTTTGTNTNTNTNTSHNYSYAR